MDVWTSAALEELTVFNGRVRKFVEEADPASLNWQPATGTDTVGALVMHMLSGEESLVALALGMEVPDHPHEHEHGHSHSHGESHGAVDKAAILARLEEVDAHVRSWLPTASAANLSQTHAKLNRQMSGATLIIHAAVHLARHMGQAQMTYSVWKQQQVAQGTRATTT